MGYYRPTLTEFLVFFAGAACVITMLLRSFVARRRVSLVQWLFLVAYVLTGAAMLVPRQPAPRVYHAGISYGAWINQLGWDEDLERRREAALALGEILKQKEHPYHSVIIGCLARAGPEAKPAVPALKELLGTADQTLREETFSAIQRIAPEEYDEIKRGGKQGG
jgi:hypothetical protein